MTKTYQVNEFLGLEDKAVPTTVSGETEKKINLLYDLLILRYNGDAKDDLEDATRNFFKSCSSVISMDNAVHGLIMGNYTLNELLKRKGFL